MANEIIYNNSVLPQISNNWNLSAKYIIDSVWLFFSSKFLQKNNYQIIN